MSAVHLEWTMVVLLGTMSEQQMAEMMVVDSEQKLVVLMDEL